jgi:2-oxo-4-hydroxy-4-carboxy--5-ureidoimidazoline (OHCU) decarboxylase
LPKVAAIVSSVPNPVLGGASLTLFATVAAVGIQTLGKVDFTDHRNLIIVTTSLALALWVTAYPDVSKSMPTGLDLLFGSGISIGGIAAILLNLLFFHLGISKGPRVAGGGTITLNEVNSMTKERFTEVFGHVVQDIPWAVERAFDQRPYADTKALREAFQDAVLTGSSEQQLELINRFHDLGAEDETGHALAVDHVALSNLPEEDHNDVVELATAYREHFGFPLVICARETEHFDRVLKNGWSRMDNSTPAEKAFALIEVAKIANYRFDDLVADANPIAAARFSRLNELA